MRLLFTNFGGVWEMAAGRRSLTALTLRLQPSPPELCKSKVASGGSLTSPVITPSPVNTRKSAGVPSGSCEMVQKTQRQRLVKQSYKAGLSLGRTIQGSKRKLNFDAEIYPGNESAAGDPAKGVPSIVKQEPQDEKPPVPSMVGKSRNRTLRRSGSSGRGDAVPEVQEGALQKVGARGKRKRFTSVPSTRQELAGKVPKIERVEETAGAVNCLKAVKEEVLDCVETSDAKPAGETSCRELVVVSNIPAEVVETPGPSRKKRALLTAAPTGTGVLVAGPAAALELSAYSGPYPTFPRPCPEECKEVAERLYQLHGSPLQLNPDRPPRRIIPIADDTPILTLSCNSDASPLGANEWSIKSEPGASDEKGQDGLAARKLIYSPGEKLALSCVSNDKAVAGCLCCLERSVLDSLVGTILSQNTTDANSSRAFHNLKRVFPSWEEVQKAEPEAVAEAIRCAGLSAQKGERIQTILTTLLQERGEISLEHLRSMSEAEIKGELCRFKGVGPKTVACVLMFHLERDEFPVDTHVFRISKMLGWVPEDADRERTYLHLNQRIPNNLKFDLHCLFVTHGRSCPNCAARGRPRRKTEGPCPLVNWSASFPSSRKRIVMSGRGAGKAEVKLIKRS